MFDVQEEGFRGQFRDLAQARGIDDPHYYDAILKIVELVVVRRGELGPSPVTVGIAGAQGSGKSTLLGLMAGQAQGMVDRWGGGWSFEGREEFMSGLELRPSTAHTGAVFVEVDGLPNPAAAVAAQHWIERLDDFAARIAEDRIEDMSAADRFPYSDAVSVEHVRQHRDELMQGIEQARAHYSALITRSVSP